MKFFHRRRRKRDRDEQLPEPPGLSHFVSVLQRGYDFSPGNTGKIYRAGMSGAFVAATISIEKIPKFKALWGERELGKAKRLTEVWASTITLHLAGNPGEDSVCRDVTTSFANVGFASSPNVTYRELRAYQLQLLEDAKLGRQGSIPLYALDFLYLRCVKALGENLDLQRLPSPVPIPSVAYLIDQRLIPEEYFLDLSGLEIPLLIQSLLVESIQSAKKQLV